MNPSMLSQAQENLRRLAANPYPGRGIVLGQSDSGLLIQAYWLMGRSAASRNRVLVEENGVVRSTVFGAAGGGDQELLVYTAMDASRGCYVASNGDHTERLMEAVRAHRDFRDALWGQDYEPDPPHFTPRIAGVLEVSGDSAGAWLAIVKANPSNESTLRCFFDYEELAPGIGWCISTYQGLGDPLPSFIGEPCALPLAGDGAAVAAALWQQLNAEHRVALAVKQIDPATKSSAVTLINRHQTG